MKMRNVLLLCLMAVLATHIGMSADILSSGNTANIPETGVPQELARWRKATYTDVRYRLHFDIPEERTERVDGWITVRIKLDAPADIVLDFREPASSVHEVSINGTLPQPCCFIQNEHIVIPAALTRAGENTVDIVFTAGDQSLNRNDEFLYTLLVPDRARTLFPCFDQPDMKMSGKRLIRRIFQTEFQSVSAGTERPHRLRQKSLQMNAVPPAGRGEAFHRNIIDPQQKIPVRFELERVFAVRRHHA